MNDDYHVRYEVRIGEAVRVVVQDDYRVDEAVAKAFAQLRQEKVTVRVPDFRDLTITVRRTP